MRRIVTCLFLIISTFIFSIDHSFFPIFGYSAERGVMFGGVYNASSSKNYRLTPELSKIDVFTYITTKKQSTISLKPKYQLRGGLLEYSGDFRYESWNTGFYKIGIDSPNDDYSYKKERFQMNNGLARRFGKFSFKINTVQCSMKFLDKEEISLMLMNNDNADSYLFENYFSNIIKFSLIFDDRNESIFPTKGNLIELAYEHSSAHIFSDEYFDKFTFDLRKYYELNYNNVIAFQAYATHNFGKPRLLNLSELGDILRGYKKNRYIDHDMFASRIEYRTFPFSVLKFRKLARTGFVAFFESGFVVDDLFGGKFEKNRYDYGLGLRWTLNKKTRLNLKVDIAVTEEGIQPSIGAMEEF